MSHRFQDDEFPLPPELAELDAELSSIRYEERPSFGPECEAELTREWSRRGAQRTLHMPRLVAAAAAVVLVAVSVPQARASLVRFVTRIQAPRSTASGPPTSSPSTLGMTPESPEAAPPDGNTDSLAGAKESGPEASAHVVTPFRGPVAVYPEILDRPGTEALIRRYYPLDLQKLGVGGTVTLRLWVDSTGAVEYANLGASSGRPELDRAALRVAPRFHFAPAQRMGRPVGTWVQFPVEFRPRPSDDDSVRLPTVKPLPAPGAPDTASPDLTPAWESGSSISSPASGEASDLLRAALDDERVLARLGPIEGVLEGEPPPGAAPTEWRAEAGRALERAMVRDPDNPAVLLALGRLRRKQGLRDEARDLFERALQRATRDGASTSSGVLAAIQEERGELFEEAWLAARNVGRVPAEALRREQCSQARPGRDAAPFASVDELVAWNYMCPRDLEDVWATSFKPDDRQGTQSFEQMMTSFRAAVAADPGNVSANVGLLLGLADEGRWEEMLAGARSFAWITHGHPDGFLLSGLALERLALPEAAEAQFDSALARLPSAEVAELEDIRAVATPAQTSEYMGLPQADRGAWLAAFWAPLDPVLSTSVNERRVEHLARTAYAHLRFGSASSDPGKVWVRYGRPDRIRAIASGPDVRTEFWDYGEGPDITFRGVAAPPDINLTSEARSYLSDLQHVLPHRYGRAGRIVESLAGQVSRFRGSQAGNTEVEIDVQTPPGLAGDGSDSLEMSVYQLGAKGQRLSLTTRSVSSAPVPVSVYSLASPEVAQIAVEVLDRKTGQVAALRTAAHLQPSQSRPTWGSDLLVTSAEIPSGWEKNPNRLWLRPETLFGPIQADRVGVYFQLYDLPASVAWYQVRAEVENRVTGEMRTVSFRPVDKREFRSAWDRRPSDSGTTSDLLIVDLEEAPSGPDILRLLVDVPGAHAPLVLERDVDLRR